uniref:Ig-like domain-containing protein n=1 Tax=uncultured Microbulbifer sp. TaxID=348147 RepID=UPI00261365B9
EGSTTASASWGDIVSNTVTVTVSGAVLTAIQVTPPAPSLAKGNRQQLTAMGTYSDGSTDDVTNAVAWNSGDTAIATVDSQGELTAVDEGDTTISASWEGIVSNTVTVTVNGAVLTAIQVTPPAPSLAKGNRQQLTAMGTFSDGTTADLTTSVAWTSSDTKIVTVDNSGQLTAVDEGIATVSASKEGVVSNTATVTVTPAVLTAIQVTPATVNLAKGNAQQLTALGRYSDGTIVTLTSVNWHSGDTAVATVDMEGQLTAVEEGNTTAYARLGGIVSNTVTVNVTGAVLTSIQVTPPAPSLAKGNTQQLTAQGTFSDGTTADLTNSVAWISSDTDIVTVDSSGQLTAVDEGTATVSASQEGIVSNTATVTITGAVLTAIQVTPASNSLAKGNSQQLTAQGTFSDGTTADLTGSVAWTSSDTHIVTVDSSGELAAVNEGNATVSASQAGIDSNTATVTVTGAVLTAIQVTPASNSLAKGTTQQLTAQGTFSDGTTEDLTYNVAWTSSDTHIVTVDSQGQLAAVNEGSATVSTSKDGVAGNAVAVTVTPAVLTSLQVIPATVSLALGSSETLFAQGTFSDGSTADRTGSVDWQSGNTAIATVDSQGKVTAVGVGSTAVSASQGGIVSNTVAVTIPVGQVQDLTLSLDAAEHFRFDWTDVPGATLYRLLENPDGLSGFSPVGTEVAQGTQTLTLNVFLCARANAQYILQACGGTGAGEVCSNSDSLSVSNTLNPITPAQLWIWESGSDSGNQPVIYGQQGIADAGNTPGGRSRAALWKDAAGDLWLFGGRVLDIAGGDSSSNDLWKWDVDTQLWTWISGSNGRTPYGVYGTKGVAHANNTPGVRERAVSWTDASGDLWLFGGFGLGESGDSGTLNDLWRWDMSLSQWVWESGSKSTDQPGVYGTRGTAGAANTPGGRQFATTWTDGAGDLWLFGGQGPAPGRLAASFNDLWKWDVNLKQWAWVSGSNRVDQSGSYGFKGIALETNRPGARIGAVSWTDSAGDLWLFGGFGRDFGANNGKLNDLWKWDVAAEQWTWVSGSNVGNRPGVYGTQGVAHIDNVPGARDYASSWTDSAGDLWLFGGSGFSTSPSPTSRGTLNDLWKWDVDTQLWTWVSGSNSRNQPGIYGEQGIASACSVPGARTDAFFWTDDNDKVWLFGGSGTNGRLSDLWNLSFQEVP